jgi:hydrophobic/amphiphilic exporter-1 (mainly G- bacteria), HAE1 family
MSLPSLCIRRPVFTTMLILLPVVLGIVGFFSMGVDLFPNVEIPVIFITTTRHGASAEEMETGVTKKIEEAVNTIAGIDELTSTSKEGISTVSIRFLLEKNRDVAQQEVQSKINAILSQLPSGTDTPIIDKFDIDASPVMSVAISGGDGRTLREVTEIADKRISQSLSSLKGVGNVTLTGGEKRAIQVVIKTDKLRGLNIGIDEVRNAIGAQNLELPGGRVDQNTREMTLRTMGRITDPEQFNDIIIKSVDGQPIRIRDVGYATDSIEELRGVAKLDDQKAVNLIIQKQSGTNTVEVIETVKAKLKELEKALAAEGRPDIKMQVIRDQSRFIKASIHEVEKHLVIGACLVSLTILLFLRDWRTMVIASISIPVSIISTFLAMNIAGFTFNNITMLALVMSVGIVIDDAVVVHENIFRWMEEKGLKAREASLGATNEVALAVMATTFSLVVIFLPIAFMSGTVGRFFQSFGITMAFSIVISLFVSFTLTPMLCSRFLKLGKKAQAAIDRGDHHHHSGGVYGVIAEAPYMWLLRKALRFRKTVVAVSVLVVLSLFPLPIGNIFAGTVKPTDTPEQKAATLAKQKRAGWANYPGLVGLLGFDFIPQDDQSEFEVALTMPSGSTLEHTSQVCNDMANEIRGLPGVTHTLITIGDVTGKLTRATGDVTKASIYVQMVDLDERAAARLPKEITQFELMKRAREMIARNGEYTDLRTSVQIPAALASGAANADVEFTLSGPDLEGLQRNATNIMNRVRQVPGLVDVDTTLPERNPELRVTIDRTRAAELGLPIRNIASALQTLVGGEVVSDYKDLSNGEQYDVWLRADHGFRSTKEMISDTTIWSPTAGPVSLSNVASLGESRGPAQIDHFQRQRKISIIANTAMYDKDNQFLFFHWTTHAKMPTGEAVAAIQKVLDELKNESDPARQLTPSYTVEFLGRAKTMAQTMGSFLMAFALSLIFMYMILAAQFESFVHPITILLAVPLTIPFAVLSLILLGQSANLYAILGVFLLFGIVKKNGILQVDYTNTLRARGIQRDPAVLEANKTRLRPILMTTVMLVAGMVPIALGQGAGAASRASMAKVIIGGQTLSLLLTLLVTPVAYTLFDDLSNFVRGKPKAKTVSPPPPPRPAAEPTPAEATVH